MAAPICTFPVRQLSSSVPPHMGLLVSWAKWETLLDPLDLLWLGSIQSQPRGSVNTNTISLPLSTHCMRPYSEGRESLYRGQLEYTRR